MHAIILAGGFGTRLRSVVSDVPKPLAPIAGRPFLAWLIDSLEAQGVSSVTLSVYHEWEKIRDYFAANPASLPISYAVEEKPLGTGGAIAFAMRQHASDTSVLVLNGDTFVKADLSGLYQMHNASSANMSIVLREVPDSGRYGRVITEQSVVTSFKQGLPGEPGYINAGIYVLSPDIFEGYRMPEAFSFEQDFMQVHVKSLKPASFVADEYFIDIGVPDDYAKACTQLPDIIVKKPHAVSA
jgi:D-glycero-alpha-D-manno-heptose 1-phosphate guanylyltransferase